MIASEERVEALLRDLARSGEVTSRGPIRRSIRFWRDASRLEAAFASDSVVSAEGLRGVLPTPLSTGPVLQREVPERGGALAAVEGPGALPPDGGESRASAGAEPAPAASVGGARAEGGNRGPARRRPCVGHRAARNRRVRAIGLAVMRRSPGRGGRRRSDSALGHADVLSSVFWSERGVGGGDGRCVVEAARDHVVSEANVLRSMLPLRSFGVDPREEGGGRSRQVVVPGRFSSLVRRGRRGDGPHRARPCGHR